MEKMKIFSHLSFGRKFPLVVSHIHYPFAESVFSMLKYIWGKHIPIVSTACLEVSSVAP